VRAEGRDHQAAEQSAETCDPPEAFTYGGMIAHVLTFAAHRRVLVLGALSDAGITDLGAGDPMEWVAQPA
jgi:AraC family transcriptional regulator